MSPTAAFKIGEKVEDPLQMYLIDIFTISANLAGICGISVPCGFTTSPKLPIGLQLLGKPFGEETILRVAHAYEQSTAWHRERRGQGGGGEWRSDGVVEWWGWKKIRRPKPEGRKKAEIRRASSLGFSRFRARVSDFGSRTSFGLRISGFGSGSVRCVEEIVVGVED